TIPLKLATDNGGKLPPGLYYLQVTSPEFQAQKIPSFRTIVIVATANMTVKVGPQEALVWVTDLKSGQPVANTKVNLYDRNSQVVASGTTDANGLFRTNAVKGTDQPYLAIASGNGVFSLGSTLWAENFRPYDFKVNQDTQPKRDVVYLY